MVFSAIHPGMLHDSSYTTVTSRGPPRKMRHLPWSVHLRWRNPRQRPVVSWPSRGEKPMRIACLDAYLPCFGWSLGLVFGGWPTLQKQRPQLGFRVGDGLRCFFLNLTSRNLGKWIGLKLPWAGLIRFLKGAKKGKFPTESLKGKWTPKLFRGADLGVVIFHFICVEAPLLRFTGEKRTVFLFGFRGFSQQLWVQMFEGDATFPGNKALQTFY